MQNSSRSSIPTAGNRSVRPPSSVAGPASVVIAAERATPAPPRAASAEDWALVAALRRREEAAFVTLVERHHAALLRLARTWVTDPAVAEEVVQETWLALLNGIDRFAGRSSLKTWLIGILANRAKSRAVREHRSVPFSALRRGDEAGPGDEIEHFLPAGDPGAGRWACPPRAWADAPEARLLLKEIHARLLAAIEALPPGHRAVILLRDVHGQTAEEACNALGLSATNQRVLLHRARAKVRAALGSYLGEGEAPAHARRADVPSDC